MDIHRPKAAHSFREFLVEIGTIICGILIALALEQAIEWLHWHDAVVTARESLRAEIARNNQYFAERLSIADCVDRHISETSDLVESIARTGRSPHVEGVGFQVGRAIETEEWNAQRAGQTLTRLPQAERASLESYYDLMETFKEWKGEDSVVWDDLSILDGPPKEFPPSDLNQLRRGLARARTLAWLWRRNTKLILDRSPQFGVARAKPTPSWPGRAVCKPLRIGTS